METPKRVIEAEVSAFPDGVTYIVEVHFPKLGRKSTIMGVVASSEEQAIDTVIGWLQGEFSQLGENVTTGPLVED